MKRRKNKLLFGTITKELLKWSRSIHRPMPWLNENDPYKVWISEVMLQQTQVSTVIDYYSRFLKKFQDVSTLADADEREVLMVWEGLGYYRRARLLHKAAKEIKYKYQGQLPDNAKVLRTLPGIGTYTSAAIASFCFGERIPAIDSNVKRVLSRLFNVKEPVSSSIAYKKLTGYALQLMEEVPDPAEFNQALINFGALVCKPAPECDRCPLQNHCSAFALHVQYKRPVKRKRIKRKKKYFLFLEYRKYGDLVVVPFSRDIWKGLYGFPHKEVDAECFNASAKSYNKVRELLPSENSFTFITTLSQTLSHREIHAHFYKVMVNKNASEPTLEYGDKYPFPRIIRDYFNCITKN